MDQSHINQNFELNKTRRKFHHSLKEHHKISNIPKLRNPQFSVILYYKQEMVTAPVRNTKITNFARLYYPHFTTFRNETLEYY
jgi:hypothetical protein